MKQIIIKLTNDKGFLLDSQGVTLIEIFGMLKYAELHYRMMAVNIIKQSNKEKLEIKTTPPKKAKLK